MMETIIFLAWMIFTLLAIQILWLTFQIAAADHVPRRRLPSSARSRLAVLIPAHNESRGISETLHSVISQLESNDRIVVIADNCEDDTAGTARACGAEVIVRSDTTRRGKGHALAFGIDHLQLDPPEIVIFVDADCLLAPQSLAWLTYTCREYDRPTQSAYLMHATESESPMRKIAVFAWTVKNWVRPLGAWRLGMGCQLHGSGMALPWTIATRAPFASSHLVEDLKLGLDLAMDGQLPIFCPEAVVESQFPEDAAGAAVQRTRWEHGHLGLILTYGPSIAFKALLKRDFALFMLAVDLCVPPLSLLVALTSAFGLIGAVTLFSSPNLYLWSGFAILPIILFSALLLAWHKAGRELISAQQIFDVVGYMCSKALLYTRFFTRRQTEWIRTERGSKKTPE